MSSPEQQRIAELEAENRRLREADEQFRQTVREVTDFAVHLMDPAGRVASWNEGAERILGYGEAEVLGESGGMFFRPEDLAAGMFERELETAARTGRATDENWLVRKSGERFWASGASTALRGEDGSLRGFVKIFRDLTDRRRAEEELRRLNAELEDRVRARTAELVERDGRLLAQAARLTRAEQGERQRLARLLHDEVQQLLVAAKMRVGNAAARAEADAAELAAAHAMLDDAITATRTLAVELDPPFLHEQGLPAALEWLVGRVRKEHRLAVTAEIDEDANPPRAECRDVLFQAAREFLLNAAKHAGRPEVTVRLARLESEVWLEVCDKGPGFACDPGEDPPGSFGLYQVRRRLESVGGELSVDSAPGGGTCMSATLSVGDAPPDRTEG